MWRNAAYGFFPKLADISCRKPWAVVVLSVLLVIGSLLFSIARFDLTADSDALISAKVPWRLNEQRMEEAFPGNTDAILVVIDGATPELAEHAAQQLDDRLAHVPAHFHRVSRLDGGAFFAREGLMFGSRADVAKATGDMVAAQPLLGPLAADPSLRGVAGAIEGMANGVTDGNVTLDRLDRPIAAMAKALDTPLNGKTGYFSWQDMLLSAKDAALLRRQLILVRPVLDYSNLKPGEPASDFIRQQAFALGLTPAQGVTIRLSGQSPLNDEEFGSVIDRAWLIAAAMVAAMTATLWFALRSVKIVVAVMLATFAGLVITTALGLAMVGRLNLISVAFIPLFVGLGVDFGIQIGVRFQAEHDRNGGVERALRKAAGELGPALLLAAGAICLGFLAFLPTSYIGISELGIIAAVGMVVALVLTATLLPALLMLLRPKSPRPLPVAPVLIAFDRHVQRHRRWVLGGFGVLIAASVALLPLVRFDFNPLHLPSAKGEAMTTLKDLMHDPDRNPNSIEILAADRGAAKQLAKRLSHLPEVGSARSVDSFIPEDQGAKLALITDTNTLLDLTLNPLTLPAPSNDAETVAALQRAAKAIRAATAGSHGAIASNASRLTASLSRLAAGGPQARTQAEAKLVAPLAIALDTIRMALSAEPVTLASLPKAIVEDWLAPDGRALVQVLPKADGSDNESLARFTGAVRRLAPDATGVAVSTQEAARTVSVAFIQASLLALGSVSVLLLLVLRSLRETILTLTPVVMSAFLTLATCVLIGQRINFANIIAFPLLFGIGVAFHIYFVMAWRGGASDLLQSSLARAIFFSAVATGTAFGSLWLSSHPGTASMGLILMIALGWTLVSALIFAPALLGPPRAHRRTRTDH
jgi:hopanoid biosynthesis associated RND transporter like protein HpnN